MDTNDIRQQDTKPHARPWIAAAVVGLTAVGIVGAATLVSRQSATQLRTEANPPAATASSQSTPSRPATSNASPVQLAPASCTDCGVVVAFRTVKVPGEGTGVGVVAGGVVGGVIGNQIGGGRGRDAARVIGAIGGAVAGHEIEKQARSSVQYQVDVRLDTGATRTLHLSAAPAVGVGERVRVDGGSIRPA